VKKIIIGPPQNLNFVNSFSEHFNFKFIIYPFILSMVKAILSKKKLDLITFFKTNTSIRKISKKLKIGRTTVARYIKKYQMTGSIREKKRSGRPVKYTDRFKRQVVNLAKKDPKNSAPQIANFLTGQSDVSISSQSVRTILNNSGIFAYRRVKKPYINPTQQQKRYQWALAKKNWSILDWSLVIFSDESKYSLDGSDGVKYVWTTPGKSLDPSLVNGVRKFGGGNIFVWGCITYYGYRSIIWVDCNMDRNVYIEILQENITSISEGMLFQDDNDPKHRAKDTLMWKNLNNVESLEWPACSPDLSIIENVWDELARRIYSGGRESAFYNQNTLWEEIKKEFYGLNQDYIKNLYSSMPNRIEECIKAKGSYTSY
jgi:transposase